MVGNNARAKHNKVRTGCLTCKARRKKCDETKPNCQRCTTTGRRCDGYATPVNGKLGILTEQGRSSLLVPDTSDVLDLTEVPEHQEVRLLRTPDVLVDLPQLSDVERHCHSYFRQLTIPHLALYFSISFWHNDLIRCALVVPHPALFYSIAAVGAVHRRYRYGISREAFEYCEHAAVLYRKALTATESLKRAIENQSAMCFRGGNLGYHHSNLVAASEMLLGIFQRFQGEDSASARHLTTSAKHLLSPPLRILHSDTWDCANPSGPGAIDKMACRLYCLATEIFGSPVRLLGYTSGLETPSLNSTLSSFPLVFYGLEEARDHIFTILEDIYRTRPADWEDRNVHNIYAEKYEGRLHEWTQACSLVAINIEEAWRKRAFNLLHLTRNLAYAMIHDNSNQGHTPRIKPTFTSLPILDAGSGADDVTQAAHAIADAVTAWQSTNHPGNCLGVVRALVERIVHKHDFLQIKPVVEMYRVPSATHREMLGCSSVEDIREAPGLLLMIQQMSAFQQGAAIAAIRHILPPDAQNVDIGCIRLDARKVLVRYYAPRLDGEGFMWVQEWWSF